MTATERPVVLLANRHRDRMECRDGLRTMLAKYGALTVLRQLAHAVQNEATDAHTAGSPEAIGAVRDLSGIAGELVNMADRAANRFAILRDVSDHHTDSEYVYAVRLATGV